MRAHHYTVEKAYDRILRGIAADGYLDVLTDGDIVRLVQHGKIYAALSAAVTG